MPHTDPYWFAQQPQRKGTAALQACCLWVEGVWRGAGGVLVAVIKETFAFIKQSLKARHFFY